MVDDRAVRFNQSKPVARYVPSYANPASKTFRNVASENARAQRAATPAPSTSSRALRQKHNFASHDFGTYSDILVTR